MDDPDRSTAADDEAEEADDGDHPRPATADGDLGPASDRTRDRTSDEVDDRQATGGDDRQAPGGDDRRPVPSDDRRQPAAADRQAPAADGRRAPAAADQRTTTADGWVGLLRRVDLRRWFGPHLLLAVALFGLAAVAGWAVARPFAPVPGPETTLDLSLLPDRFTVGTIFLHNLRVAVITALGVVTLGLASAAALLLNGFLVGFVYAAAAAVLSAPVALALILPHAVFELPAFWIVAAAAFRVNHRGLRYLLGADDTVLTRQELVELGVVFGLAVALLAVAAWVEVTVTPGFGRFVSGG